MTLCVHGLGHVGLAAGALFAHEGHEVVGYDTDETVRRRLRDREPAIDEPAFAAFVTDALRNGLSVRSEPVAADVHLVCVPTPYDHERDRAVLDHVTAAGRNVARVVRPGDTVVLESTVPPGTTTGRFQRAVASEGTTGFRLGYSPETVLPGDTVREIRTNDRIVGGVDPDSTEALVELYEPATTGTIHEAPDPTTAEFVKLAQNAARDTEIAYANTLALLADDHGVDVRTAIALANEHPRVDVLDPGPGVGGHCLPVDPWFLDTDGTGVIRAARRVNDRMPTHVVDRLVDALDAPGRSRVAVLGVAYKGNVGDTRNSPGLAIADRLATTVRAVRLHDPHATDDRLSLESFADALRGADAVVVAAAHDEFATVDPTRVADLMTGRLAVDPAAGLARERWRDHDFRVLDV